VVALNCICSICAWLPWNRSIRTCRCADGPRGTDGKRSPIASTKSPKAPRKFTLSSGTSGTKSNELILLLRMLTIDGSAREGARRIELRQVTEEVSRQELVSWSSRFPFSTAAVPYWRKGNRMATAHEPYSLRARFPEPAQSQGAPRRKLCPRYTC
jgi:hypothetical protein